MVKTITTSELRALYANADAAKPKKQRKPKQISFFGEAATAKPKAKRKKLIPALLDEGPKATTTLTEPVSLHIPGDPCPWTAPQFSGAKGGRAGYRSKRLREWYAYAVPLLKSQWMPRAPIGHAVQLDIVAVFPRSRILKALQDTWPKCRTWMTSRPDVDNVVKACSDSLSLAYVWSDDCLVVSGNKTKVIAADGEESGVYITISPVAALPAPKPS